MNAINDFLLNLFTGNDFVRKNLMFPNLYNSVVYATDGYAIIAIPQEELTLSYQTNEKYPNAEKLLLDIENREKKQSVKIKVSDLAKELAKARLEADKFMIKCAECDGTGEVEWEYYAKDRETHFEDFECPICDGTGKIEMTNPFPRIEISNANDNIDIRMQIGDLEYYPFIMYKLFMVAILKGKEEIEMFYSETEESCFIKIDEIKIIITQVKIRTND